MRDNTFREDLYYRLNEDKIIGLARRNSLTLRGLQREYIVEVLGECGGSRKKTAQRLGITTATLWRKLKQYEKEAEVQLQTTLRGGVPSLP